ncbi:MAG: hypothetical protein KGQ59_11090 [Bdellovibrionales bacterium]|nr:hypothetical protein [Bdellovibrionales bacterium]
MTFRKSAKTVLVMLSVGSLFGCSYNVKIEPSDKPFIVNLNVKVDHEVKLQIQEKNKDLLQLENQAIQQKPKS